MLIFFQYLLKDNVLTKKMPLREGHQSQLLC